MEPETTQVGDVGIRNIVEMERALFRTSAILFRHLKDGFQPGKDIQALVGEVMASEAYRADIAKAFEGVGEIPAEVKDVKGMEFFALVQVAFEEMKGTFFPA